ncbi:ATP-grasp domain-containing protein [Helicobacter muridarum]|uniref:ATP-grasp domain-containing protein n=1 Tax=Helicobacter muridarum TaxID=216 RepID=A0A377PX77_9HELI|nr:ATP-grasp domain-containing protein [Helicobacter muridarum]TLE00023.1 ATP-grasp domain-containing protein [Helicobacter muridarum]STQ87099.1 bifunctional glutamate--cysteine ligase/glutathione synthetase [Helicobacter muridarum]
MKKILIAGGKFTDIPTIKAAKRLGFFVITSGNNKDDLGHSYADKTILCDYSDKEAMLDIAKKEKICALFSACDDFSALTCSFISEHLNIGNFDSFETTKTIHHKDLWREFLQKNNLVTPKAKGFSNIESALHEIPRIFKDSKVIIKPVDFATGKGISQIQISKNTDITPNIKQAMNASRSGHIVVEEFLEGSNHGFSTLIKDQKVIFYFYDNELHDYNPFAVSGTTTSNIFSSEIIQNIVHQIEKIARTLHLKDGIFHTQIILTNTAQGKKPFIIEVCRRAGGDLYSEFIAKSCGIDYMRLAISLHNNLQIHAIYANEQTKILESIPQYDSNIKFIINNNYNINKQMMKNYINTADCEINFPILNLKPTMRICLMTHKQGIYNGIRHSSLVKSLITDQVIWAKRGEKIDDNTRYKAGIVFLKCQDYTQIQEVLYDLRDSIQIYE